MEENSELFFLDILNGKVLIATVTDLIIFMLLKKKMCEELNLKKKVFFLQRSNEINLLC